MPFPRLELNTAKYLLRPPVDADLPLVFAGLSDPRVIAHYGVRYATLEETVEQMRWYAQIQREETGQWWCICKPHMPEQLLGACGLNNIDATHCRAELGYWLLPEYWRQGVAAESVAAVIRHAFDHMAIHRIEADVDMDNHASSALLHRLGFTLEGVRRGYEMKDERPIDLKLFARLSTDG